MISKSLREANPNCAKAFASLRLYGDELVPENISRLLRIEPSDSAAKGSQFTSRSGKTRTARTGLWILSTEFHIESTNLEDHIEWLMDQMEPAGVIPTDLPGVSWGDVFCYWLSATGHGGPELSPDLLARLGKLRLKLGLDIYFAHSDS